MKQGKTTFFGLQIDVRRQEKLCADICDWLDRSATAKAVSCFRQQSLNAVKLPQAIGNPDLFYALENATCLSADGMGVVWAARLMGIKLPQRVTGIDLMKALLPRFAKQGLSVFLLGARADVLEKLSDKLRDTYPDLVIAGMHHGYEPDDAKLAEIVRKSGADALFVALPSPRKELFVEHFSVQTGCRFAMGVGGAFDVLAGKVTRAPLIWQKAGLEFLWRIMCQPKYMIPRYASGLVGFAKLVAPGIVAHHAKRLRHWAKQAAFIGTVVPMILCAGEPHAQVVWADGFAQGDPQVTADWMNAKLAGISDPDDVQDVIDEIVNRVLAPADEALSVDIKDSEIDWQAADTSIRALLGLFDVVLAGMGANSFLLEAVLGGVVKQILNIHPEPERLAGLVQTTAPDLAARVFGVGGRNRDGFSAPILVVQSGAPKPSPTVIQQPAKAPRVIQIPSYQAFNTGTFAMFADGAGWGVSDEEKDTVRIPELENVSPR
ncbi:WecB/TagA/CpsF family glycosyltransferase [Thalassospira lucentensis]|uniref:WecB/TagA/CpsF family glycosyltransferase n=1 Tax=Thalassospira lucentensis TaxID=168935 RepID=UPI003D2ECCBD